VLSHNHGRRRIVAVRPPAPPLYELSGQTTASAIDGPGEQSATKTGPVERSEWTTSDGLLGLARRKGDVTPLLA
jgi:hypothetical protein